MNGKMAIFGPGAIGSSVGADLTKAGYPVLLVDQWPAHVEAMKSTGLRVIMPEEELQVQVQAIHLCDLCSLKPQFDIVFLTAKSYDTRWMVELIKPYLKPDGVLVSMQNSLNDEWISPVIGRERDIACAFELDADVRAGVVVRNTDRVNTYFVLGEIDGRITPRVHGVAKILSAVGKTQVTNNIWGAKWTKLIINTTASSLGALSGRGSWEMFQNPKYLDFAVKLGAETVRVGVALKYVLEPLYGLTAEDLALSTEETLKKLLQRLTATVGKDARSVMLKDLLRGRLTEVDFLNGLVVRKGREVNVPTPLNERVASLVKELEQGRMKPSLSNLDMLVG